MWHKLTRSKYNEYNPPQFASLNYVHIYFNNFYQTLSLSWVQKSTSHVPIDYMLDFCTRFSFFVLDKGYRKSIKWFRRTLLVPTNIFSIENTLMSRRGNKRICQTFNSLFRVICHSICTSVHLYSRLRTRANVKRRPLFFNYYRLISK